MLNLWTKLYVVQYIFLDFIINQKYKKVFYGSYGEKSIKKTLSSYRVTLGHMIMYRVT